MPACRSTRCSRKGGVTILSSTRLEDTGSDHLPVLVEFSLKRDETKPVDEDATATVSLIAARHGRG